MAQFNVISNTGLTSGYCNIVIYGPDGKVKVPSSGGGSGTVTSFSAGNLSPLFTTSVGTPTTTPALSFSLSSVGSGNFVFASPNGISGTPSFRALVASDIPSLPYGTGTVTSVGLSSGTGISIGGTNPVTTSGTISVTNTAPDQTVVLGTVGTGFSVTGTYPNFTLENTLPDQTVALSNGAGISITGTYPNFTITNTSPSSGGTVTSVQLASGTGISLSGTNPITSSGTITVTNSAPDQTVSLTAGDDSLLATGTYPNFIVSANKVILGATVTNNLTNTLIDVTGLVLPVVAGVPAHFRAFIIYSSSSTAVGSRFTINGPAITDLHYYSTVSLSATSVTNNQGLSAYQLPAATNGTSASTNGNIAIVEGILIPAASGNLQVQFACETNLGSITVDIGSNFRLL